VGYGATLADALDQVFGAGAGSGTTKPANPDQNGTTSPPGGSTPTPSPATTPAPPGGGGGTSAAVSDLNKALQDFNTAKSSGDLGAIGQSLTKLDAAVKAYQQAAGQSGAASPTPTTPAPAPAPNPAPTTTVAPRPTG